MIQELKPSSQEVLSERPKSDQSDFSECERFYVYRSLHSDESWGALIAGTNIVLPNCDFLIQVLAVNETQAIAKGRELYDKIHKNDGKKNHIRKLTEAALQSIAGSVCKDAKRLNNVSNDMIEEISKVAVRLAVETEKECERYLNTIRD